MAEPWEKFTFTKVEEVPERGKGGGHSKWLKVVEEFWKGPADVVRLDVDYPPDVTNGYLCGIAMGINHCAKRYGIDVFAMKRGWDIFLAKGRNRYVAEKTTSKTTAK